MKFGIVCDVDGLFHLDNGMTIEQESLTYIFYITDDGFLKQVRIITTVDDSEKYYYRKTPIRPDGSFESIPGYEAHIKDRLIREMQRLESTLALVGNLKRVHWEKATMEYYAETEAEHARLDIMPAWFFVREMNLNFPTHIETPTLTQL